MPVSSLLCDWHSVYILGTAVESTYLVHNLWIDFFARDVKKQCAEETIHLGHKLYDLGIIMTRGHYSLCDCFMHLYHCQGVYHFYFFSSDKTAYRTSHRKQMM